VGIGGPHREHGSVPLVGHLALPTFAEMRAAGQDVLTLEQALRQDIRELHVGFLNMMPDAALRSTERQFFQLLGSCNQIAQVYVHPFTIPGLTRSSETQQYLDTSYERFEDLRASGLDALIITGANVATPNLVSEPLWKPLQEVIAWASQEVTSVLCSCLATHALLKSLYGIDRRPLTSKRWGVYRHRCARVSHPLLRNINTLFDVPHSRHNEVTRQQLEEAGLKVLIESCQGDVHLAVSPDQLRFVFLQGHPEYDFNSLYKEYKREVLRYQLGQRNDDPPHPENYFEESVAALVRQQPLAEERIEGELHNTWGDTGKAIFNNWLGLVYRLTHLDRKKPFVDGIDPENPLGLR
jgi:homoserine O-succinyltransferase